MRRLWARPFETFVALLLLVVGVTQAFTSVGYPVAMTRILPVWGLRVYGLYVLVGAVGWLFAIRGDSLLCERAVLTALAGALFAVAAAEVWLVTSSGVGEGWGFAETLVWQVGIGVAAVLRATYITRLIRVVS